MATLHTFSAPAHFDQAWEKLGRIARSRGISKSQLLVLIVTEYLDHNPFDEISAVRRVLKQVRENLEADGDDFWRSNLCSNTALYCGLNTDDFKAAILKLMEEEG